MITDINSEDRLVQYTVAEHLRTALDWESVYAFNQETFGPDGTLGRRNEREVVLVRDLRAAIDKLNGELPESAREQAVQKLTQVDASRSLLQHNRDFYRFIRGGVPVDWRDERGEMQYGAARVVDFRKPDNNCFLAVRELKIQGIRVPHYNRRADVVCFLNGLPLVFIELKAVYKNVRVGFDENLTDYMHAHSIAHAFHHNAFLVVSNGDRAKYGSITSKWEHFVEWKRNDEKAKGRVDAQALLDGMLEKGRLLDIIENFILFDDSRAGGTRKIVARNHQVLGVNNAVASVLRQEELKDEFPRDRRVREYTVSREEIAHDADSREPATIEAHRPVLPEASDDLPVVERAHRDLGRLGVFWHTQGSGKSYSMAFFAEKVRRVVRGNFTFVVMTDREDLDDQIWRTFIGFGAIDESTPRAASGKELQEILTENHRYVFSLIHKFNQPVRAPYSERDDIIVISDEAHRTQAGKFARNMWLALPNASFIGFTGTPLFRHDELTRRIFGSYISRYDFKRSEEDNSTVKLAYENRGEKLGLARLDLNDRIAEKVEEADLDPDQTALLEKLLGQDYEVVTADNRLDRLADDFVEHCSTRWEAGKSMLVCIDKVTCARMFQRIETRWQFKLNEVRAAIPKVEAELSAASTDDDRERLTNELGRLRGQADWMESTIIEIIISEAQNEVRDFARWGFDIVPHRVVMKTGFATPDGRRLAVDDAFKDPEHPFRIAIVCAMWLTGFDVECLSTVYIDKPMKTHNLMQAIARANRVFPGKECGVIVDYNGVLKSLQQALAQYALGDDDTDDDGDIIAPIEVLVASLLDAIEVAEDHLRKLGFDPARLIGLSGFARIEALRDAVDALEATDEDKRRFQIMARQIFSRFKILLMEPSVFAYAERHDNVLAIYKKLEEKRDTADVTDLLKELHRIVNDAIRTQAPGEDQAEGLRVDLSEINFEKLRREFATKVMRKNIALQDVRTAVEEKLAQMLARNPTRMDYYRKYQEIIADYNREKDRVTVEETFARLVELAQSLDAEQRRAVEEGLTDHELALFDLLCKENITKADRERVKQASKTLIASLVELLKPMSDWIQNTATQAEVKVLILDTLWQSLPRPPFTDEETEAAAGRVYDYVWGLGASRESLAA